MRNSRLFQVLLAGILFYSVYHVGRADGLSLSRDLDTRGVFQAWEAIQQSYLRRDKVDSENLSVGMIKGLVSSLDDPHSSFMDSEEAELFTTSLSSELKGIGAELRKVDGLVKVVAPLPNTPAERAGILPGDVILKVDGAMILDTDDLFDVVLKIRGPEGTEVVLSVLHEGDFSPVDIPIIRAAIHIDTVTLETKSYHGDEYAYLHIGQFTQDVDSEFLKALSKAKSDGLDRLILDLRFNGGGFLDGAVDIASYFLKAGTPVVHTRSREEESPRLSVSKPMAWDGDVVVLVNEISASASEIVAGALQDHKRATIIGVKTFGKGSVQEVRPIGAYGLLRLTIAEWLTPEKKSIEGSGISPDVLVEMVSKAFQTDEDAQLLTAEKHLFQVN